MIKYLTIVLLSCLWASTAWAQADYAYSSGNFDDVQGAYTTAMNVTGGLTLSARLPANLPPGTDISAEVLSYSFNDGVQTLTQDNSRIEAMQVSTDSFCRIATWAVTFWQGTDPISGIDTLYSPGVPDESRDDGFIDSPCTSFDGASCIQLSATGGNDYGQLQAFDPGTPGTWTGPECLETPPPEYAYSSENFNEVQGAYTTAMNVTGGLILTAPLPPNLPPNTDISAEVLSYSFNDGVQTLTQDNSRIEAMRVSTDSFCRIATWAITFWQGTDPISGIDTLYSPGVPDESRDDGFIDSPCDSFEDGSCIQLSATSGTDYGQLQAFDPGTPGTWTGPECPETPPPEYAYTSGYFNEVQGAYTAAMNVTGGLILTAPLPPNLPSNTDISAEVLSYRFNDGVQTLTQDNSRIEAMRVSTDSFCRIATWAITFWQGTDPISGIDTLYSPGVPDESRDDGFIDSPCTSFNGASCIQLSATGGTDYGQLSSVDPATPGTWTGPICAAIPAADMRGLALLILLLVSCGAWFLARGRPA